MPIRLKQKPVIWIGSIFLLAVALLLVFVFLLKSYSTAEEQHKGEQKRLSQIFATLDSSYRENKNQNLLLSEEAIHISESINDSNALSKSLFNKARVLLSFEQTDSILIIINQALSIAEQFKNDTLIARIKNLLGNFYSNRDNYYLAMLYYTEVKKTADNLRDKTLSGLASNGLGMVHQQLTNFDRSIEYFNRAYNAFKGSGSGNIRDAAGALLNIGNSYIGKNDFIKAAFYQGKALVMARQIHNTEMINMISLNLGLINQRLKNDSTALNYYSQVLEYSKQNNNRRLYGTILLNLGSLYADNNQLSKAEDFFHQSLLIFSAIGSKSFETKANMGLSDVKNQQGQWQEAYGYYLRGTELRDSILNLETQKKITDYQWEMESQKKKYEAELLLKKYEIQKKGNLILAILSISIIIIAFMFSGYLKKSMKLQKIENEHMQEKILDDKKIYELEKLKHQVEIEAKNKELTTLSLHLVTKNEILTDISEMTNKLYKAQSMNESSYNNLKKIIKESLSADKDWEQFISMFEKIHQNFFIKLKQISPELSENELRLCAYLKINLSNHEIARILNISPGTIKTSRYRIRKKLNLENKTVLEDYIREI